MKNLKLHVERMGQGQPLLILHGWAGHMAPMKAVFEPLFTCESTIERIYIDLPGMAESVATLSVLTTDFVLKSLIEFIQAEIKGPLLLAGYSYGGYLARAISAQIPEQIKGLFLLAPMIEPAHDKRQLPDVDWFYETAICKQARKKSDSFWLVQNEVALDQLRKHYGLQKSIAQVPVFEKPTLILLGQQDGTVGYKDQLKMLDDYPRASFAILDMAGHNLQAEQSQVFNFFVKNWLERCEKNG